MAHVYTIYYTKSKSQLRIYLKDVIGMSCILKLIMNLDGLFEGVSDSLRVLIDVVQTKPGHSEPREVNT